MKNTIDDVKPYGIKSQWCLSICIKLVGDYRTALPMNGCIHKIVGSYNKKKFRKIKNDKKWNEQNSFRRV